MTALNPGAKIWYIRSNDTDWGMERDSSDPDMDGGHLREKACHLLVVGARLRNCILLLSLCRSSRPWPELFSRDVSWQTAQLSALLLYLITIYIYHPTKMIMAGYTL